ncbi:MAG: glycerophosphodiester phosphodiesterase [Ruminococcaceae bacterium]|nr:glycerophosphodiester phosphodiesterase [Oscillospiraceae bacterium]
MAKINVISHRGANMVAPQNTLPAFKKSFEIGCDGVETDIHLTKDGIPVLCHNFTIDETSDGEGAIKDMTLEELRQYDFGSYKGEEFKGTEIPLLDDFIALCAENNVEVLNIELKSEVFGEASIELPQKTIELAKKHNMFEKLIVSSFDPAILVVCKKLDPNCKTGLLYSPAEKIGRRIMFRPMAFAKEIGADALHPFKMFINKGYVKKAHKMGLMVNPWTVNKDKEIEKMISCGVDGIITDNPGLCNTLINENA